MKRKLISSIPNCEFLTQQAAALPPPHRNDSSETLAVRHSSHTEYSFLNMEAEFKLAKTPSPPSKERRPSKFRKSLVMKALPMSPSEHKMQQKPPSLNILSFGEKLQLSKLERANNFTDLFKHYLRSLGHEKTFSAFKEKKSQLNSGESTALPSHNISSSDILLTEVSGDNDTPRQVNQSCFARTLSVKVDTGHGSFAAKLRSQASSCRRDEASPSGACSSRSSLLTPPSKSHNPGVKIELKKRSGGMFAKTPRFKVRTAFLRSPRTKKEFVAVG